MRVLAFVLPLILLNACSDHQMLDLTLYVEQIKARPASGIDLPPKPTPIVPFAYTPENRPDPFATQFAWPEPPPNHVDQVHSAVQPNWQRQRETLEKHSLDSLRMVGTLSRDGARWALVRSQDDVIHRVAIGDYMGQQHGRIVDIQEARIVLVELVRAADGFREKRVALGLDHRE